MKSLFILLALATSSVLANEAFIPDNKAYPRSKSELSSGLSKVKKTKISGPGKKGHHKALMRLMEYRFLCNVPHDIKLNEKQNELAHFASKINLLQNKLDHHPIKKPAGMKDEDFKKGQQGCAQSNLHYSSKKASMTGAVDGFMKDAGKNNMSRVGHRRWCLNPAMSATGFGLNKTYAAMYAFDRKRDQVPEYDSVSFPAKGYFPKRYFGADYLWHISLNPTRYQAPKKDQIKIKVYKLTVRGGKFTKKTEVEIEYSAVDNSGIGIPNAIIFKPKKIKLSGAFGVEISGIKKRDGSAITKRYVVHFY